MTHEEETEFMKEIKQRIDFRGRLTLFFIGFFALFFPGFVIVITTRSIIKKIINDFPLEERLKLNQLVKDLDD
jgi:hypothetical protein